MTRERYVLLGLAQVGSAWFRATGRWSTDGTLPVELVKTVSVEEVRSRLRSGRAFSALLVDDAVPGLERDLFDLAAASGCAVVVVDAGRTSRSWVELGAAATLPPAFDAHALLQVLGQVARPIGAEGGVVAERLDPTSAPVDDEPPGRLVAVTGAGGTGASTVGMALAQHAAQHHDAGAVLLADLALRADQALLHGTPDVVPGVQELAEAHRLGTPDAASVRSLTWQIATRGYDLLLGLRRPRDWTSLRPATVRATVASLRRTYALTVADVDADLDGERETGSLDVEERSALARTTVTAANLVVVVGDPHLKGVHSLLRVVHDVLDHGVEPARLLPLVNRAPRSPRARAEVARALAALGRGRAARAGTGAERAGPPGPVFLGERRHLDLTLRDVARLPEAWLRPVGTAVLELLARTAGPTAATGTEPVLLPAGSLGAWTDEGPPGD